MHASNCGHAITRDDVSVTDLNSKLYALEAWHIRSEPHSMNQEYTIQVVTHSLQKWICICKIKFPS